MPQASRLIPRLALVAVLASLQGCFDDPVGNGGTPTGVPSDTSATASDPARGNPPVDSGKPATLPQNPDSGKTPARPDALLELKDAEAWRSRLIPDSAAIPLNGFKAFYFEDSTGLAKVDTERVAFPALSYAYSGPYGIPAQRFDAYWIGKFEFAADTVWRIDLSQSNSVARILIDGREIFVGETSRTTLHAFAKGAHTIEIQYKNDWHTISFSVLFSPVVAERPAPGIDTAATGAEYWFAGAYESGRSDLTVDVALAKSAKPVILFLSSYEVVRWRVLPADSAQVLAVFVDSYQPQSTVEGLPASVPVTARKGIPFAYKLQPDCYAQTGYCEENVFAKLVGFLAAEFQISLTGYSGAYNPSSLNVPELILDSAKYAEIAERARAAAEAARLRGLADVFPGDTAATWQAHFPAPDAEIPVSRFRAFYFSDRRPETIVHTDTPSDVAMKYSWSEFHGLDANDFAGYWIGKFRFEAPVRLSFRVAQSHAQTAIYVDKRRVLSGTDDADTAYSVPEGTHLIEIQHINNWHTIDFAVTLGADLEP